MKLYNRSVKKSLNALRKKLLMTAFTCISYLIGHLPIGIYYIYKYSNRNRKFSLLLIQILFTVYDSSFTLSFPIYYFFNNNFKKNTKMLFGFKSN
jgi:uncharacterized membrane protein